MNRKAKPDYEETYSKNDVIVAAIAAGTIGFIIGTIIWVIIFP